MTLILGIEYDGGVVMGCDSFFGEDSYDLMDRPKWTQRKNLLVATAGEMRMGQLVERAALKAKRRRGEDDVAFVLRAVIDPIHASVRGEDPHKKSDFEGLAVVDNRLYVLTADLGVYRSNRAWACIGSGSSAAGGILSVNQFGTDGEEKSPIARAREALIGSANTCAYVREPFHIVDVRQSTRGRKSKE